MTGRYFTYALASAITVAMAPSAQATMQAASCTSRDFATFDSLRLRSPALGEEVTVHIRYPVKCATGPSSVLVALMPETDATRIAADLRRRELEEGAQGVIVVSLSGVDNMNDDTIAETLAGPVYEGQPSRFSDFIADELKPLLEKEFGLGSRYLIAGEAVFGRVALQAAIERHGVFAGAIVVDPQLTAQDVSRLRSRLGSSQGLAPAIALLRDPASTSLPPMLEALRDAKFALELEDMADNGEPTSHFVSRNIAKMASTPAR